MTTRGFTGRRQTGGNVDRIPPGQHLVDDFPVLTAGPTQHIDPETWTFTPEGRAKTHKDVELA